MTDTIYNTHEQLKAAVQSGTIGKSKAVCVCYSARIEGRSGWGHIPGARVSSPFFETDPKAHWSQYGQKRFSNLGLNWRAQIEFAKSWASKKYGIKAWARNRSGDFVPAEVNEKHPIPKREKGA